MSWAHEPGSGLGCDVQAHIDESLFPEVHPRYKAFFESPASGDIEIDAANSVYTPSYTIELEFEYEGCVASPCVMTVYSMHVELLGQETVNGVTVSEVGAELASPVAAEVDPYGDFSFDGEDMIGLYLHWTQNDGSSGDETFSALVTNGLDELAGNVTIAGATPVMSLDGSFQLALGGISGALDLELDGEVTNRPPVAAISNLPSSIECIEDSEAPGHMSIDLDGSASADPDQNISHFVWWINDGDAVEHGAQTATLLPPGEHEVVLIVHDSDGAVSRASQTITITDTLERCLGT